MKWVERVGSGGRTAAALVAAATLGGSMLLATSPASQAATAKCLVINARMGTTYSDLQSAAEAARPGATLWVRGACPGANISTDLTITGQQPGKGFSPPALTSTTRVYATVRFNTLSMTGDVGDSALENFGVATLKGVTISGNMTGAEGGGINNSGTVYLNEGTTISHNHTNNVGGGIQNYGSVVMNPGSSITQNAASAGGGGIYNEPGGTATGASATNITGNTPDNCAGTPTPGCVG
jgi:hypothetical protein